MPSQSDRTFEQDLVSYVLTHRTEQNEPAYAAIINRLDKPVGGLVLFAKNKKAAAGLSAVSGEHGIEKNYYALVKGSPCDKGEFTDYLLKDGKIPRAVKKRFCYTKSLEKKQLTAKNIH